MFGRMLRVLLGFIAACLVAGITKVLFVTTPAELAGLPTDVAADRVAAGSVIALAVATQSAIFSAPFALLGAVIGEWRRVRSLSYYAFVGILIAILGFVTQYAGEQAGQPTIVNTYALTAFLTAGFMAGLFYWIVSGRSAGGREPANRAVLASSSKGEPASAAAGPARSA